MRDECVESVKNDERLSADNKSEAVSRFNARNVIAVDFGPLPVQHGPNLLDSARRVFALAAPD